MKTKTKYFLLFIFIINFSFGEQLDSIIEFFSFTCMHCYVAEPHLLNVLKKTNAQFMPVFVPHNDNELPTALIYYAAIKAGIGWQFREGYFKAMKSGLPPYTVQTALTVLTSITNNPKQILDMSTKPEIINKINLDKKLIQQYNVSSTPTFIINNQYTLVGDSALSRFE